jgi:hypothetical protein
VRQDTGIFQVAVIDFTNTGTDGATAIGQAVAALGEKGNVKFNMQARVQRNYGRYLNIAGNDGSNTIAAVFFGNGRLYEIEGSVPASNPDALSGEMIRFQQSIRFIGRRGGRARSPAGSRARAVSGQRAAWWTESGTAKCGSGDAGGLTAIRSLPSPEVSPVP